MAILINRMLESDKLVKIRRGFSLTTELKSSSDIVGRNLWLSTEV